MKLDMRNPSYSSRFRLKKRVYGFTFLFASLALTLSFVTFSRFYPYSSLLSATAFGSLVNAGVEEDAAADIMNTITEKIIKEIQAIKEESNIELQRPRYIAFLTEILGLVSPLKNRMPVSSTESGSAATHPLSRSGNSYDESMEFFLVEEIRKYVKIKPNRLRKQNFMGTNGTFTSIGHACFSMKEELEEYMDYDVGDFCKDDWKTAQKLMVHGCDPLPRRRCFARAPKLYTKPFPINKSLWKLPEDRNVRWSHYRCKSFKCLARNATGKGFFKCSDCFNLTHHESPRWMQAVNIDPSTNSTTDFLIEDVLNIKPGEIRIGLDFSAGTGTFAARMREHNVSIITATINFGAPFSEMIALRGLLSLYLTVNQRLPFFDNTLDLIHTTRFLDGWIDLILLDFVLYDWDRVLRPGGMLWIDNFFCLEKDLEDYLEAFKILRYKKHRWVIVPKVDKDGSEVFFSALLEKPPRPF